MSEAGVLVRGATHLLTGGAGAAARARGGNAVRVRDGVIAAIGTLLPQAGERVIDAAGCVIYPGWVNTHQHAGLTHGPPRCHASRPAPIATAAPWRRTTRRRWR